MTFIRATPGPSRLPWRTAIRSISQTASASAKAALGSSSAGGADGAETGRVEANESAGWLATQGQAYARATGGQRAAWLGGSVPYASNPSFRPPPPLSNRTQDIIAKTLRRGDKTVGQIAEEYHVSKARIEAIRKLKEVEAEFKRQSLPLQTAFLNGMEPLLGVTTPQPKSQLPRDSDWRPHQSVGIEREEENRLEVGIGAHGAFADRSVASEIKEGIERVAFEYRDEETMLEERRAEARARAAKDVSNEAEARVAGQSVAPETPEHEQELKREEKAAVQSVKSNVVSAGASGRANYRFVDTSSTPKRKQTRAK